MVFSKIVLSRSTASLSLRRNLFSNKYSLHNLIYNRYLVKSFSTSTSASSTEKSTTPNSKTEKSQNQISKIAFEDYDDYDANEPHGAAGYATIVFRLLLIGFGLGCMGLTINELFLKRMFQRRSETIVKP